ncbi:hypothetical protein M231_07882 [Tremella mesenterica]|uniref:Uncharacterized protein n=1 Tax=Tremella mesenterica TaxID=5217 RepID=A0A4Q1BB03_TREME|nr:hypothetical protein M231_07882 [Tremella mesenterica]
MNRELLTQSPSTPSGSKTQASTFTPIDRANGMSISRGLRSTPSGEDYFIKEQDELSRHTVTDNGTWGESSSVASSTPIATPPESEIDFPFNTQVTHGLEHDHLAMNMKSLTIGNDPSRKKKSVPEWYMEDFTFVMCRPQVQPDISRTVLDSLDNLQVRTLEYCLSETEEEIETEWPSLSIAFVKGPVRGLITTRDMSRDFLTRPGLRVSNWKVSYNDNAIMQFEADP